MVETRIAPRYQVHKPAIVNYGGDKYACTIRDISATGAAIEFAELVKTLPIKRAFTLVMQDQDAKPLIILMHGDRQVSLQIDAKRVEPCKPDAA